MELWVRLDSLTAQATFAGYGTFGTLTQAYALGALSDGRVFFSQWGDAIFGPVLQTGQWYHVAATNVGSSVTLYLNGAAVGSKSMTLNTPAGTSLYIGRIPTQSPSQPLDGQVDEVGVYSRALTAPEIQSIFAAGSAGKVGDLGNRRNGIQVSGGATNNIVGGPAEAARNVIAGNVNDGVNVSGNTHPSGTVSWWRGEGNSTDSIDGNPGTLVNGTTFAPGQFRQSFSFDGVNDYVNVNSTSNLQIATALTVSAWINLAEDPSTRSSQAIIVKGVDAQAPLDWALHVTGNDFTISGPGRLRPHVMAGGQWVYFDGSTVLQTNRWYHVAMSYDGTVLRVYLDGQLDGAVPLSGTIQVSSGSLRIGAYAPVNGTVSKHFFSGRIDEPAIFNRGLTVNELQMMYQARGAGLGRNVVEGNYIGANAAGDRDQGNRGDGVEVSNSAANFISGNVISGNDLNGILVSGTTSTGTVIQGNHVGLNAAGTAGVPNSSRGVLVQGSAAGTRIGTNGDGVADAAERNVLSGNRFENLWITGTGVDDTVVAGNYVGTNAAGTAAITNGGGAGMAVVGGAKRTRVGTNADGVSDVLERNVISGNRAEGLLIADSGTQFTAVAGNYIGLNAAGTAAIPNLTLGGIFLRTQAADTRIGTNGDGINDDIERNVISGNAVHGIQISNAGTDRTWIAGNYIGTDWTGTLSVPNFHGIGVYDGADDTRIGTNADGVSDALERNIISGNSGWAAVVIANEGTDRTVVAGNYIGTNVAGTAALTNTGHSIAVLSGPDDTRIGTDGNGVFDSAERNVTSGNWWGVVVEGIGTARTVIAGNYMRTDWTGNAKIPNNDGVTVRWGAVDTRIGTDGNNNGFDANERNVISGNNWVGIQLHSPLWNGEMPAGGATTDRTVIAGNFIGLRADGTGPLGNLSTGIYSHSRVTNTRIGTNADGVADELERNMISGNGYAGIHVEGWAFMNLLVADQLVSGVIPRTTASTTIAQADLVDPGWSAGGNWNHNNPLPGGGGDYFVHRSTGTIEVSTAGQYTFAMSGDDGGRLRINGSNVIVDDALHGFDSRFATVTLGVGTHTFEWVGLEYNSSSGWELSVAVGGGKTAPITEANGWKVLGSSTPHPQIRLQAGTSIATTAYYPTPGNLNTSIAGNYIGMNVSGMGPMPNTSDAVLLTNQAEGVRIGTNGDGINDLSDRNLLSGNGRAGVYMYGTNTRNNVVAGNYIGTDVTGTLDLGNAGDGVRLEAGASNNTIGGSVAAARNVISGNSQGVQILGAGTNNNIVAGNYAGVDASGMAILGNSGWGVIIGTGATNNRVGTNGDGVADAAERNVLSGNFWNGLIIYGAGTSGNVAAGNYIGTDATGSGAMPNGGAGLTLWDGASNNRIGTDGNGVADAAERNVISGNAKTGVVTR
jgi:hypothetical protein